MIDLVKRVSMLCAGLVLVANTSIAEDSRNVVLDNKNHVPYRLSGSNWTREYGYPKVYVFESKNITQWNLVRQDYGDSTFEVNFKIGRFDGVDSEEVVGSLQGSLVLSYRF